jgi:hypothetical protein
MLQHKYTTTRSKSGGEAPRARVPESTRLTRSFGRNLKARKRERRSAEPTRGKRIASWGGRVMGGWWWRREGRERRERGERVESEAAGSGAVSRRRRFCSPANPKPNTPAQPPPRLRTFLVIASSGGAGLALRQQPASTAAEAVATMLSDGGTAVRSGAAKSAARRAWERGAGTRRGGSAATAAAAAASARVAGAIAARSVSARSGDGYARAGSRIKCSVVR